MIINTFYFKVGGSGPSIVVVAEHYSVLNNACIDTTVLVCQSFETEN